MNKDNKDIKELSINNNNNEDDKKKFWIKKIKLKEYKEKLKIKYLEKKSKITRNINDEYDIKIYSKKIK